MHTEIVFFLDFFITKKIFYSGQLLLYFFLYDLDVIIVNAKVVWMVCFFKYF